MTAVAAPFGLRPSYHPSGLDRPKVYTLAAGYATAIFTQDPVILNATGTITIGTAAADLLGIFDGVEYVDPTGKPTYSNFWPAGQAVLAGTTPTAYVWDDPQIVYVGQGSASIPASAIGNQCDVIMGAGSTQTGLSTTALNASLAGAGSQGQFRIVGFDLDPNNAAGDAFTVVQVQLARS